MDPDRTGLEQSRHDATTLPAKETGTFGSSQRVVRDRYTLARLHAKGGIGQVWLADDGDLGRQVALKELLPERAGQPAILARFLEEAKITGQLEHPGIVPVYELVRSPQGDKAFYTMRFVKGRTLSEAVQAYHHKRQAGQAGPLDLRELLGAFVGVGKALAYAHSRGVIHRDLKGPNVLLGDFGEVIVLDWGLAKTLGQTADDRDPLPGNAIAPVSVDEETTRQETVQGMVLGTPAYMSPEQAEGRLDVLDARTDVSGLGALLYEVLTGRPPFRGASTAEILKRVINDSPTPPCQVVPDTSPALQAICLKALAKRPEERYASAGALVQDVERWLADEPVTAWPEPRRVRLARWGKKHRTLVATAAALLLATVVGLSLGLVMLDEANGRTNEQRLRAEENFTLAETRRIDAETNLLKARKAEAKAKSSAAQAEAINDFLVQDLLAEAAPERNPHGKQVTVAEVLDRAADKVETRFKGEPTVEAAIRRVLGSTYYKLGKYEKGEVHARRAFELWREAEGPDFVETLDAANVRNALLRVQGKVADAEPLCRQNLDDCRRVLGAAHETTIVARDNLARVLGEQRKWTEAEPLARQTVEDSHRGLGPDHKLTIGATTTLTIVLKEQGKFKEAEPICRRCLESHRRVFGGENPRTLFAESVLGQVLEYTGKLDEAESLFRHNLDAFRQMAGPTHPDTLGALTNMAVVLRLQGKLKEAEPLARECLAGHCNIFGPQHNKTLVPRGSLSKVLNGLGKRQEAEALARENLDLSRKLLGEDHASTVMAANDVAVVLQNEGKHGEAEPFLRACLPGFRRHYGPDHPDTFTVMNNLATCLKEQKKFKEAEEIHREVLDLQRKKLPPKHPALATSLSLLGLTLIEAGKPKEAEYVLRECLEIRQQALPKGHWQTANVQSLLGAALAGQSRFEEAEPLLLQAYQGLVAAKSGPAERRQDALDRIIKLYEAWGKSDKATEWREKKEKPSLNK